MKRFVTYMTVLTCSVASMLNSVEPYDATRTITYVPYTLQDGYYLYNEVIAQNTTLFIDVGSQGGAVARYIAANTNGSVNIFNINSWSNNENDFQTFLSNVIQENQATNIIPIRMNSLEACVGLNLVSQCIYIETDPNNIYADIIGWSSHLAPQGVITGNHWEWSDVEFQVIRAASLLNMTVTVNGTYWFLKKL